MKLLEAIELICDGGVIYPHKIPSSCQDEYDRMWLLHWVVINGVLMESIMGNSRPTKYTQALLLTNDFARDDFIVEKDGVLYD